jgi:hypothetical protein
LNGVLRDRLNCLTRKTHAFAKRVCLWVVTPPSNDSWYNQGRR